MEGEATLVVVERWFAHGRVEGIPIVAGDAAWMDVALGRGPGINGKVEMYGRPVAGAKVEVRPAGGDDVRTATTGDDGLYELLVPPGMYEVTVEVSGRDGAVVKLSGKADVRPDWFTRVFLILKKEDG